MVINKDNPKALTKMYLPGPGILTKKVDALSPDSVLYQVCLELVELNRSHIESFDGKMVLSLIKKCSKVYGRKPTRAKKPKQYW